jgi:septal ring factor EnvC (AmiA/AmiB activator)
MKTSKELDDCREQIAENQSINNHLVLQRDEFLNYYIKGQILAMALVKDKTRFCEMQGVSRWLLATYRMFREENRRDFEAAYYLEANLKKDETRLNTDNSTLEKENGELSQFTKDGEVIRNNMNRLTAERDKIAADIAETDDDLKELQDRNADLIAAVAKYEKEADVVKAAGGNKKFKEAPTARAPKKKEDDQPPPANETSEEKAKRERFDKLAKLSSAGLR